MKFLFVVPRFHPNLYFAVKALQANGHTVDMVVTKGASDYGLVDRIVVKPDVGALEALKIINEVKPDVIILRNFGKGWLNFYWMSFFASKKIRTFEYSLRASNRNYSLPTEILRQIGVRPRTRISPVIWPSVKTTARRSFYVPFPITVGAENAPPKTDMDAPVRVLCVGKLLEKRKQQDLLLDAAEQLAADYSFTITFVGTTRGRWPGVSEEHFAALRRRAEEGPLASRIQILPDVPYAEMPAIYQSHDLFVLPAFKEPLGFSVPEAMAYGCAVVIADSCGAIGYVTPANGVTFKERNVEDLKAKLQRLLADPPLVAAMGRAAVETIRRDHTLEAYAARMETLGRSGRLL